LVVSRRTVLRFGALSAASALLAACGQAATPTTAPAAKPTQPAGATKPAEPAAQAKPTAAAAPAGASTPAAAATKPSAEAKPTAAATQAAAAPAGAPTATPTPAVVGQGQKELWWATPGNPDEVKVYQASAEQFVQKNPGYKVKLDRNASDRAKLVTMIAGNQAPDLIFSTINDFPATAVKNVWAPLDDYIKADSYDLQDFYDQILKPYRMEGKRFGDGKLYGLPKEIAVRSMFYNADIFSQVDVKQPDPKEPWTWEQFLENTLKAVKREGDRTTRYAYVQETWWGPWAIWAWANGGEVVDDPWSPTKATMDDPKVIEALTFWTDFVVKHKAAPTLAVMQQQGRAEIFAGGLAASYNNGRWMVPLFRKSSFKWDVMPMPKKQQRAQLLTGSIFGIWTGGKQRDDTWKLLAWVNGKESQQLMTRLGLLLPSRKSVAEGDDFLKSTPPTNNQVYLDEIQFARILPMHPAYPEMQKAVDDQVALILAGSKSVKDAVGEMNAKVTSLLKG
jgi:multiple sugar transport system substrate-binding protein